MSMDNPDYLYVAKLCIVRCVSIASMYDVGDMVKLANRGSLLTCRLQQHARLGAVQG
jgi:hypothetical protein